MVSKLCLGRLLPSPLPMECDTETMNELNMLGAVTQYIFPRAPPGGNSLGKANPGV